MHRKFLAVILAIFSSALIFAQNSTSADGDLQIYLNANLSVKKYIHIPQTALQGNIGCSLYLPDWKMTELISAEKNMLDSFSSVMYLPLSTNMFSLGLHSILHTETEFQTYQDFDFLTGAYFSFHGAKHFIFEASAFYMLKATQIFYIKENFPWLFTNSLAAKLNFLCPINDLFSAGFEFSSYNETKFNSFITPFFTLYGNYNITDDIKLHCAIQANYIDMFTLSANLNNITFTAGADWRLK